mgnify:CR=1 FL=1
MSIEEKILKNLVKNDEYSRKVIPFLNKKYFTEESIKIVFDEIKKFTMKYNDIPTVEIIEIELDKRKDLTEVTHGRCSTILTEIKADVSDDKIEWLVEETEKFCKDRAVYNAIMSSINIIDGKSQELTENAIPEILSDALSVSFDTNIGHDYIVDYNERYEFYHKVEKKVPFDLEFFNSITGGGTPTKTLNIVMAGTGVGKSLFMCHHAANCLIQNLNVLYITCEMAEERIAERIDANLMDIRLDDLRDLPYDIYKSKIKSKFGNVTGKLIVKEYPTASAGVHHFRVLLDELKMKKKFKPDIIFIDYLNICASSRLRNNGIVNSYTYVKAIAEEIRGLAVEQDVPIWSATQTNREGFSSSDIELEHTSESFGLPATADFMIALIVTEELADNNQVMIKQLKNRYNDTAINRKFILGIDKSKMKLYDSKITNHGLVGAGQTDIEVNGVGFSKETFDDKFKVKKSNNFTDWKI